METKERDDVMQKNLISFFYFRPHPFFRPPVSFCFNNLSLIKILHFPDKKYFISNSRVF